MKKHLTSVAALIGAAMISVSAFAADPMQPQSGGGTSAGTTTDANSGVSKTDIVGRAVVDASGTKVGTVKDVRTDAQGTATNLLVTVGKKDVLLPASEVKIASNDTIQTTKSAKEIKKLPAASASDSDAMSPTGANPSDPGMKGGGSGATGAPSGSPSAPGSPY